MVYYKQDLNNQITVLALLANGIPSYRKITKKPLKVITDFNKLDEYHIYKPFSNACPKNMRYSKSIQRYYQAFISGISKESYNQKLLYYFSRCLEPLTNSINFNGIYIKLLHVAVITSKTAIYILYFNNKQNGKVIKYKMNKKLLNQIFINLLHYISKKPIGKYTKALGAMQNLWVAQTQKYNIKIKNKHKNKTKTNKNIDFQKLLKMLLIDILHYGKKSTPFLKLTYNDVINFYKEVRHSNVTNKTRNVQDWLYSKMNIPNKEKYHQILNIMKLHRNFYKVVSSIKEISINNSKISKIRQKINQDKYVKKSKFHLIDAFKFNDNKPQCKGIHHFVGVHGTNSYSIPTIITDGLLTPNELIYHKRCQWDDIGQAFGNGVYMAKLSQASKSLNYSNSYNSKYKWLIIVNVAYSHPVKENDYSNMPKQKNYDFILGNGVGFAHGYSEYVARYSNQIKPEYLLAFSKK